MSKFHYSYTKQKNFAIVFTPEEVKMRLNSFKFSMFSSSEKPSLSMRKAISILFSWKKCFNWFVHFFQTIYRKNNSYPIYPSTDE